MHYSNSYYVLQCGDDCFISSVQMGLPFHIQYGTTGNPSNAMRFFKVDDKVLEKAKQYLPNIHFTYVNQNCVTKKVEQDKHEKNS